MGDDFGGLGLNVLALPSPRQSGPEKMLPGWAVTGPLLSTPAPPQTYSCEDPGCPVCIIPGQNWKAKCKRLQDYEFLSKHSSGCLCIATPAKYSGFRSPPAAGTLPVNTGVSLLPTTCNLDLATQAPL